MIIVKRCLLLKEKNIEDYLIEVSNVFKNIGNRWV